MSSGVFAIRLAPRWVHVWAIVTVIAGACLLAIGSLVTTFRVGMADPIWPTTPWYLFSADWSEPKPGFFIEHAHRIAAFAVGGASYVLAIGIWLTDPRAWSRWFGLAALVALLGGFGGFHYKLMEQVKAPEIVLPVLFVQVMGGALAVLALCLLAGGARGTLGAGLRALGVVALVAVMIQGLLGGFRVRLNDLAGTDLAAVHGFFAQVVWAVLVGLSVLTARPTAKPPMHPHDRLHCRRLAAGLVLAVLLQLAWGALLRHNPTPLAQRLHLLTAFAVVAVAVWLIHAAHQSLTTWNRLNRAGILLAILIAFQIMLGVEAWMGKFTTGVLPELQKITTQLAIIRTAHMLVGTGILATSFSLVLLTRRPAAIAAGTPVHAATASPAFADSHHSEAPREDSRS
jgi:heme a synthase